MHARTGDHPSKARARTDVPSSAATRGARASRRSGVGCRQDEVCPSAGPLSLLATIAAFILLAAIPLRAHDIFSSAAEAQVHADKIELRLIVARTSAVYFLANPRTLPPVTPENFDRYEPQLVDVAPDLFAIFGDGGNTSLPLLSIDVALSGDDDVEFQLVYSRPASGPLVFRARYLQYLVDGHVATFVVSNAAGKPLGWEPLSIDHPNFQIPLPSPEAADDESPAVVSPSFGTFLRLGVHHILIGFDHLLFLLGLLIACRRFRTMVGIITCFTVAHSITLGLAAFEVFTISPDIIEPLIAASIVFVGLENLMNRGQEPKRRWLLTFAFGLIHGFGFAGALKEVGLGLSGSALAMPLFSFNLGVELGQIAVAAIALPILWALRKRETFALYGPPVVSSLVALAGAYWLVDRTLFS